VIPGGCREIVDGSLSHAKAVWAKHGVEVVKFKAAARLDEGAVPSSIPGHPTVDAPSVDTFVALVMDMRDSSIHAAQAIATAKASQLERVFYETAALLPVSAHIVAHFHGHVTEYLGDGLLALFQVPDQQAGTIIGNAVSAGFSMIECVRAIVNPAIKAQFDLPALQIGVGLAYSPALVARVGVLGQQQAKAFGQCVFRASKLADGHDIVKVDDWLWLTWPKVDGGKISGRRFKSPAGFDAHELTKGS
jgi:hypothetical protein